MSDLHSPHIAAARAEDLSDLLSHIAYTDTLRPALLKLRTQYEQALVYATLGQKVLLDRSASLTCEQIAARAEAITYLITLIEKILSKGASAVAELQRTQLTTTP